MRKAFALLTSLVFCVLLLPAIVLGQGNSSEVKHPDHFDKSPKPLREMFDTGYTIADLERTGQYAPELRRRRKRRPTKAKHAGAGK